MVTNINIRIKIIRLICFFGIILGGMSSVYAAGIFSDVRFLELYSMADKPDRAQQWLDSIRQVAITDNYQNISKGRIDYMEAFIVSRQFDSMHAIDLLQGILKESEVDDDSEFKLEVYLALVNEYSTLENYPLSLYYIIHGLELGNRVKGTVFPFLNIGMSTAFVCADLMLMEQAHECILTCHKLLEKEMIKQEANLNTLPLWLLFVYEVDLSIYYQEKNYQKMEDIAEVQLELINNISDDKSLQDPWIGEVRKFKGIAELSLAIAKVYQGKKEIQCNFRITDSFLRKYPYRFQKSVSYRLLDYYIEVDSLEQAIELVDWNKKNFYTRQDTMSLGYTLFLVLQARLYAKKGDYKEAAYMARNLSGIKSKIMAKMEMEFPLQMKYLHEAINLDIQLRHENIRLKNSYIRMFSILSLLFLLLLYFYLYRKNVNSMRIKKSKLLKFEKENETNTLLLHNVEREFQQIKVILMYRTSTNSSPGSDDLPEKEQSKITGSSKRDLSAIFSHLEQLMNEKQLFLDPKINRDRISQELSTNKLYLSEAIAQHTGLTFSNYILGFRLSYACNLLLKTSDTIESVASQSGFRSARTFYRIFHEKTGVSPAQFRMNNDIK